jgi:protease-4
MKPFTALLACCVAVLSAIAVGDPATQPAQDHVAADKPTAAQLLAELKKDQNADDAQPKVAYFDLSLPITEKPPAFDLFGDGGNSVTLHDLVVRLHKARDDASLKGVLITLSADSGMNLAQAEEIRNALAEITRAGKKTFVYADGYDTDTYTMASGAGTICMLPGGDMEMPGVGLEAMFAKGLLDKVGVQADYVQIGEYKGADEEFTRTGASDELRGELNKLTDSLYKEIVSGISTARHLPEQQVEDAIDQAIMTAQGAKDRGLIDELIDEDGLRPMLTKALGGDPDLVADYGGAKRDQIDLSSPFAFFQLLTKHEPESSGPTVAIIYAEGVIADGAGGNGLFSSSGVASDEMRKAFRIASREDDIKAVVIRIDSPGGSALASEAMWQGVRRLAEKKPVYISVGTMAASGGYYLACAGDKIYADPAAIIGSIGVVGGKFVYKDLFDKLGLHTEVFDRGANSDLFSSNQPFTDRQRKMVTSWMTQTYNQFTDRVMTTRKGKIKDIDAVARGRIFVAQQAKDLGMVDEIGGLEDAIAGAAADAGLGKTGYDVRVVPAPKTLGDIIAGGGPDAAFPFAPKAQQAAAADSILNVLGGPAHAALLEELQTLQLLQERPVVLAMPFIVSIK